MTDILIVIINEEYRVDIEIVPPVDGVLVE